ncbi:MAG TPA: hypothetical protein VHO70_08505 [Chitinispirillaceae bacterium]|nr:hypothetical protein [Chitinispirillaceae bacterium]
MIKQLMLSLFFIILSIFKTSAFDIDWLSDYRGKNSGHTTCNFLTLPHSSNVLARGLASSPGTMDATDLPLFSANSALSNRNKFALNHLQWLMGLKKEYTGALFPLQDIGTFGCYAQIFTPGKIEFARDINEQPSKPSLIELALGTSYARAFLDKKINVGVSAAYIESRLDKEAGRAFSGSLDLLISPVKQISSRLYLANFGTGVSYGTTSEPLPLQGGLSLLIHPLPSYLPITAKFNFDMGIGVRKTADEPVIAGISTAVKAGQYFSILTGYEYTYGKKASISGLGLGAGFHYRMYGFEAAWKNLSPDLGPVWSATVKFQLEEKKQRTAEDYYKVAEKFYKLQRFVLSRNYAVKALRMDPNMWKAHALLNRIKSEQLRNSKQEIAIVYTSNLKNQFLPPPYSGSPGGIARQGTVLKTLQSQFPVIFTIQAGNIITANANEMQTRLAALYLQHVNFDAICVGNGEFAHDTKILSESGFQDNLIIGNIKDHKLQYKPFKILKNSGYKLYITSFINDNLIPEKMRSSMNGLNVDNLLNSDAKSCDLRILIIHDSWQNITKYAQKLQKFEIIICGSLDQHFAAPMKVGKTFLLSAGDAGKYLGNLILRFDQNKKLLAVDNNLIPITSEIKADSALSSFAELISAKIDLQNQKDSALNVKKESTDGVFTFLSNRDGKSEIYLKLIGRNAEFPLTRNIGECINPVMSETAGKVAYTVSDSGGCGKLEMTDLTGANRRLVCDSIDQIGAAFTPDGKWLYYSVAHCHDKFSDIYRTSCEGGPSYPVLCWPKSSEHSISFSNNNEYILFCSNRDGKDQIFLSNQTAEHPLNITDVDANHLQPAFSPDDQFIGYLSDRSNFGGKLDLWIYDRIKAIHIQITHNSNVKSFCWLSDSKTLVYSSGVNLLDLTKVDITTFRYSKLGMLSTIRTYNEKYPRTIKINGEETIIYERDFENGERQIFSVKPDGTEEHCIINSQAMDWLDYK